MPARDSAAVAVSHQTAPVAVTKLRSIRIDDELWEQAQAIAAARRTTVTAVLKQALVDYVEADASQVQATDSQSDG